MSKDLFSGLVWEREKWKGSVSIPYFRGVGSEFLNPQRDEVLRPWGGAASNAEADAQRGPEKPNEFDARFEEAKFEITFDVGSKKRAVPNAQKQAWEKIAAGGDGPWDRVMQVVQADYQLQRPVRVKCWEATYGDLPFDRELPEIPDVETLKKYCRPYVILVHPPNKGDGAVIVGVLFLCTWIRDGFAIRFRDGAFEEIGPARDVWMPSGQRVVDHSALGRIELFDRTWHGTIRFPSMLRFHRIAEERAKFNGDRAQRERPQSKMWWNFAHGQFGLYGYVNDSGADLDGRQVDAIGELRRNEQSNFATILDALVKRYNDRLEENYRSYDGKFADAAFPNVQNASDFRDVIELVNVYVHPPDTDGKVRIAFELHCSFELSCIVLWRDGAVERFGKWKDHAPEKAK